VVIKLFFFVLQG